MTLVNKTFSQLITFTRASSATFTGSNGLIQSATTNTPRFDYDPVTLAAKGLLIEEQRTNLVTYSEQFDNAAWTKSQVTVTANAAVSPDGTTTAEKLIANTTNIEHLCRSILTLTAATHTLSVYAKANEYSWVVLTGVSFANAKASFNLSSGTVGVVSGSGSPVASIYDAGNGWFRCVLTFTASASSASYGFALANGNDDTFFAGNGTDGIFIWGAQFEAGSFATSYIPTVASQVTRSNDVASVNTLSPWFNATEGTLFVEASQPSIFASSRTAASITNNATNRLNVYRQAAGNVQGFITPGAGALATTVIAIANVPWKGALGYGTTTGSFVANGSAAASGSHTISLGTLNSLAIGSVAATGGETFNGHIRRITYYKRRLSNADLQSITL